MHIDIFKNGVVVSAKEIMDKVLVDLKTNNENKRAKYRQSILDRYTGDNISKSLNSYFSENAKSLARVAEQNVIKQIVNNEAQVYREMPVASFPTDEPAEGEEAVEAVELPEEYDQVKRWMVFQKAEIRTRLLGTGLIRVKWNEKLNGGKGAVDWEYIYNYRVFTAGDDPHTPIAIAYPLEQHIADSTQPANTQWWVWWSEKEHFHFTLGGKRAKPTEKNKKMVNPYGVLPFVSVHPDYQDGEYWVQTPQVDTVNVMDSMNKGITEGRIGVRFAMGQRYISGQTDQNDIQLGIDFLLEVPSGEVYDHKTPGSDFDGMIAMIKFDWKVMLFNHGQAAEFVEDATAPASGFSLVVRNLPLTRLWKFSLGLWRWYDKDVYAIEQIISKKEGGAKLPDGRHLDYAEPKIPRTIDENINQENHDLELGLTNLAVLAMQRDPDAFDNEGQAIEAIEHNKEVNANLEFQGANAAPPAQNFLLPQGAEQPIVPAAGDES